MTKVIEPVLSKPIIFTAWLEDSAMLNHSLKMGPSINFRAIREVNSTLINAIDDLAVKGGNRPNCNSACSLAAGPMYFTGPDE